MPIQLSISNAIKGDAPLGGVTPPFNQYSFEFDGNTDFISVADADNLSFGNGTTDSPFSISAWIKMTDATRFYVVSKGLVFSTNYEYLLNTNGSDKLGLYIYDSSTNGRKGRIYDTALTSYENQWIHICGTYNGNGLATGLKLYINGTQVDDADSNSGSYIAMENGNRPLNIGRTEAGVYSNGKIDEVAIFNSELSSSDVSTIYGTGKPSDLSALSPLSWWRMGDAATWSGKYWDLIDQGSGGNDGFSDTIPGPPAQPSTDIPT